MTSAAGLASVPRRRQHRLLGYVVPEGSCVRHRLHELSVGAARRIGGETAELPLRADLSEAGGPGDLVVGDVVDLERAGVHVAQDQVGRARAAHRGDAGELPIQSHRAEKREPVIALLAMS